jgi:hypothetical protein
VQRLQRERGVAHPGVAVVPVALTPRRLRQRRGQRGHRRPGRGVGQALDGQRRPLDLAGPPVIGDARLGQPRPPVRLGRGHPVPGLVEGGRPGQSFPPGQGRERPLAGVQHPPAPGPVALDAEGQVGTQPDGLPVAGRVGRVTVAALQGPGGRRLAVAERRGADEVQFHVAVDTLDRPQQDVVGVLIGGRPPVWGHRVIRGPGADGQRVAHHQPARRRPVRCHHHVRARLVDAGRGVVDAVRPHAEVARLAVEQRAEDARGVKARHAQPLHRPVGRHQGAGVAVRQERVALDGRERRRRRDGSLGAGDLQMQRVRAGRGDLPLGRGQASLGRRSGRGRRGGGRGPGRGSRLGGTGLRGP